MATREIKIGLMSYVRADGPEDTTLWGFGLLGDKVDVHESDLGRFDSLNGPVVAETPELPESVAVQANDVEPPRSGKGSGLDSWLDYAMTLGLEVPEGASRDDVIALVDEQKN